MKHNKQGGPMSTELTKEQRVVVRVCDEWLKEAGLPLYSELTQKIEEQPEPSVALIDFVGLV